MLKFTIPSKRLLSTTSIRRLQVTDLSNGLTVATSNNTSNPDDSNVIGIVINSGSSSETPYNNGVSNLISNIFKNSNDNITKASNLGLSLSTNIDREFQSYLINFNNSNQLPLALDFIQSNLLPSINDTNVSKAKAKLLSSLDDFESNNHQERVIEHLYATAFQNTPLSLTKRGTIESVSNLEASDVQSFANKFFTNSNAVLVATGNDINHEEIISHANKTVVSLNNNATTTTPPVTPKSTFLGSEVRVRDDTLPKAWISVAVESEPLSSSDYYTAQVASEIFGSYNAFEPRSRLQGIKLLDNLQEYNLCDSFTHFNHSFNNTGLWGFTTTTRNFSNIDDLLHFTLKQWNRLSVSITEQEVERGKALLKIKLGKPIQNTTLATILGSRLLNQLPQPDITEAYKKIDSITVKDIKNWSSNRLWDQDVAMAGVGQIEGLLDYMRIRNDMSMMRW